MVRDVLNWLISQSWFGIVIVPLFFTVLTVLINRLSSREQPEDRDWFIGTELCFASLGENVTFATIDVGLPNRKVLGPFIIALLFILGILLWHAHYIRYNSAPDREKILPSCLAGAFSLVLIWIIWVV
jgi:hypothetical protein